MARDLYVRTSSRIPSPVFFNDYNEVLILELSLGSFVIIPLFVFLLS